jgi:hypothetical protein
MPFDPTKVAVAIAGGLSAVCASCERYWAAREGGLPGHLCGTKTGCGSPMVGDVFHEYEGPMKGSLRNWCFVCGSKSRFGIKVRGKLGVIGVCEAHVHYVKQYAVKAKPVEAPPDVRDAAGVEPVMEPPKKGLLSTIMEEEAKYAAGDGLEVPEEAVSGSS